MEQTVQEQNKFKVWETAKKRWSYENCYINEDGYICYEKHSYSGTYMDRIEGVVVWYIGRNDKDGNEVYAGDIVKIQTGENVFDTGVIEWNKEYLCWETNGTRSGLNRFFLYPFEVIGNIYDHPDLTATQPSPQNQEK